MDYRKLFILVEAQSYLEGRLMLRDLASVVRRVDSAIDRINHYLADEC